VPEAAVRMEALDGSSAEENQCWRHCTVAVGIRGGAEVSSAHEILNDAPVRMGNDQSDLLSRSSARPVFHPTQP
jgi:hypothetical protein